MDAKVVGNKHDADRIPGIDILLEEGDQLSIGNSIFAQLLKFLGIQKDI